MRRWLLACGACLLVPGLALALSLVPAAAASSPSPSASGSPAASSSPAAGGDATNGATVFGQNCASCHGASMEGGVGPTLNPIEHCGNTKNPLDPAYLTDVITNGLNGANCSVALKAMPAKGGSSTLKDKDIQDVVAYILQQNELSKKGVKPPLTGHELALANVKWVTIGILVMLILTWMLARYNMRWIDRRAAARRERLARQERE